MARHEDTGTGAVLKIKKPIYEQLIKVCPQFKSYKEDWQYRSSEEPIKIPVRRFDEKALRSLRELFKGKVQENQWILKQIDSHLDVLLNPNTKVIQTLRQLESALIAYIRKDIINAWLFEVDEKIEIMMPWQVYDIAYHPAFKTKDDYVPANVIMYLARWSKNEPTTTRIYWHDNDLGGESTVHQLLSAKALHHETPTLTTAYEKVEKQFLKWRAMLGDQFIGDGFFTGKTDSGWSSRHPRAMKGERLIIDDRCETIENRHQTVLFRNHEVADDEDDTGDDYGSATEERCRLPVTPFIFCFSLHTHDEGWVHINHMKQYVYRPELRDKLILPPEHADLIDALTSDMDILMEDIITGKSGGTCVIAQGPAGTGKTLTAEVYAEVIKRPLYRVHSGQLGTTAESVEAALQAATNNASRWRALLLIDEGDVFVSKRDDNLEKNAVVGVFLRIMEYYPGVLFITTNRLDIIDEAILSRCIAQLQFKMPGLAERVKLWITLGGVYGMPLVENKAMAEKLAKKFECSGRDIKGLIRLVTKYCRQRKIKPTFDTFVRMAAFKNL
ncbi:MAG: ATP-binding protein [Candidatus Binatia bacterium]|nr:ATP-binding protein [Candidatus Binatia bacterium]